MSISFASDGFRGAAGRPGPGNLDPARNTGHSREPASADVTGDMWNQFLDMRNNNEYTADMNEGMDRPKGIRQAGASTGRLASQIAPSSECRQGSALIPGSLRVQVFAVLLPPTGSRSGRLVSKVRAASAVSPAGLRGLLGIAPRSSQWVLRSICALQRAAPCLMPGFGDQGPEDRGQGRLAQFRTCRHRPRVDLPIESSVPGHGSREAICLRLPVTSGLGGRRLDA